MLLKERFLVKENSLCGFSCNLMMRSDPLIAQNNISNIISLGSNFFCLFSCYWKHKLFYYFYLFYNYFTCSPLFPYVLGKNKSLEWPSKGIQLGFNSQDDGFFYFSWNYGLCIRQASSQGMMLRVFSSHLYEQATAAKAIAYSVT